MKRTLYRILYGIVGISVFRKLYQEYHLLESSMKSPSIDSPLLLQVGVVNAFFVVSMLSVRLLRTLVFGDGLRAGEMQTIKEKFQYTAFEFVVGLLIYRNTDHIGSMELVQYTLLFASLLILKSFHYLCDLRVQRYFRVHAYNCAHGHIRSNSQSSTHHLLIGISLLMLIDCLMFYKAQRDHNPLFLIFGYEALNMFPLIMTTMVQFLSNYDIQNSRPSYLFLINLIRMALLLTYSYFFHRAFQLPLHMIPSGYRCFRLLLTNMRQLVKHKRDIRRFEVYETLPRGKGSNDACFCLEDLSDSTDRDSTRLLHCGHSYHFECLKWWLVKSETCPICREQVTMNIHEYNQHKKTTITITTTTT